MNLQRYISTVYSEIIPEKYYKTLDKELTLVAGTDITFKSLLRDYTIVNKSYGSGDNLDRYLIHTQFFEILFGNHLETVYQRTKNTVFLFPVYFDIESERRFIDLIKEHYTKFLKHKKEEEFSRFIDDPIDDKSKDEKPNGNMVLYIPVFLDGEEDSKEFTDRINSYFDRAFSFINDVRQKKAADATGKAPNKFESIVYTVDKDKRFFTSYYKKKLPEENIKSLNGIIEKFVEKLGCRISDVKDPLLKLTRDDARKKIVSDNREKDLKGSSRKDSLYLLIEKFNDVYKKTNDREYLKLASSSENQTKFRIYYRVNNTDIVDNFAEIKPGSSYVYKIKDSTDKENPCRIGYFKERKGTTNQYVFREYKGLTTVNCDTEIKQAKEAIEEEEDKDFKDDTTSNVDEYIIETKTYGNIIKYKRVVRGNYKPVYPGIVEPFMDLHIYEKYKWFQFNEIDGTLSTDTNIKIYKNILFDKKSLIGFLKEKKLFTEKTRLAVEFLKINQSNPLLSEYVDYILTNKKSTNVYVETLFSGKLKTFVEKNKKSILEILFQTNELIYLNPQRTSQTKENIKQNYKIINHSSYPILNSQDITNHFGKIIYEDAEIKYCKQNKCELTHDMIKSESEDNPLEYAITIVDVTKDNVDVASELKAKTNCKKLKRTLRKQLQPFLQMFMPRVGGRKLRTRRRKNRH